MLFSTHLRCSILTALLVAGAGICLAGAADDYTNFETVPVRPLALSPDGTRLFAVNTPDGQLEIFEVRSTGLRHRASVPVGIEPVAVNARSDDEVWVVNHLSDSVSVVDVASEPPRVIRTLLVGDEPWDVVFGGDRITPAALFPRAFVSATRRGQNHPELPHDDYKVPGVGRADVWVFDAEAPGAPLGGTPERIVQLFGDKPRSLAVSADGRRVFATVFHSGNQTVPINGGAVCNGGPDRGPCTIAAAAADDPPVAGEPGTGDPVILPGGLPAPNSDADGVPQEEVGLIVKWSLATERWEDELGRNWNGAVPFELPDLDVFSIDAAAEEPTPLDAFAGVGTINFQVVAHPDGRLYVANTEAVNEVRFEGSGERGTTVRGHLHEARVTVIGPDGVQPRHLNKHIDYDAKPVPAGVRERTLAQPAALTLSPDGSRLYVAAFGSAAVGVFETAELDADTFTPSVRARIPVSGGGPAGLALDAEGERLFVYTRFDNAVSVVDLAEGREVAKQRLHNPEPEVVIAGRRFLYDAELSSGNGESSCGVCHVFGDKDDLAWDLGNPDGRVVVNQNPFVLGTAEQFHPLKGPMTTQTLRGMDNHGPMHWRGDRSGALDPASGDFQDEHAAFTQFNGAFESLLGRDEGPVSEAEMNAFAAFALTIVPPPNPIRPLDNLDTERIARGRHTYMTFQVNALGTCNRCHTLAPLAGFLGTAGLSVFDPGDFKIPHLRNVYDKVGAFGFIGINPQGNAGTTLGPQIRGTGLGNDGSLGSIKSFLLFAGFSFPRGAEGKGEVEDFVLEFPSNMAPIVGQQVTRTAAAGADVDARIALMMEQADTPWLVRGNQGTQSCDLIVKGVVDGEARGWLFEPEGGVFVDDRGGSWLADELTGLSELPEHELTYSCAPPGAGFRMGVDRDGDGVRDGDERDAGTDPAAAGSVPGACRDEIDNDGDGLVDHPADPDCASPEASSELPPEPAPEVTVDVLPRRAVNRLVLRPRNRVMVALLGSSEVDVDGIDYAGLRFGPGGAPPLDAQWLSRWRPDVDRDGHPDLLLRFRVQATGLGPADTEACVDGALDGAPFRACDAVRVVAPRRPPWWARWLARWSG